MVYDEDDSGDISLSLPLSQSSPQLSSILNGGPSRSAAGPSRLPTISSPTPQRLLGKGLWKQSPSSPVPSPHLLFTGREEDTDDNLTSSPTPPTTLFPASQQQQPRSSSAVTPAKKAQEGTIPMNRRTSSSNSLKRSKSMNVNVRLPSADLSAASKGPSSATSRTPSVRLGWNRRPGDPRPPPLIAEETAGRMSRWIKEVVVCNFDLERGPVVERRIMGRRWGPGEKENVAFSSFPDTSLFAEGSIMFSFKIRHIPPDPSTLSHPEPPSPMPDRTLNPLAAAQGISRGPSPVDGASATSQMSTGEKAAEYRKWDERGREWLYGFVWFEQRRDGGIARGYMQKSLVILTHLPFPTLFAAVLSRVAPIFFEHGYSALEAACHSIASWPDPIPDTVLELPVMSELLSIKMPDTRETPQVGLVPSYGNPERPLLASLPPSTPLRAFASFLPSLWSLWECLILAEPVLVIAPDPRTCSEIVWWLRDLLRPIPPAGDFRPYLHIHDHDFSLLINSNKPQPGVVVGVTNPFFRNAASHWPNVISIPSDRPRRVAVNGSAPPPMMKVDQPEGFVSKRQRNVQKDRPLLKRLEALVAEGKHDDPVGNEALRTHFQQLTEKMLVPLNRYFQTLVPTLSPSPSPSPQPSPLASHPKPGSTTPLQLSGIKPFSLPAFLTHLKTRGPNPLNFRNKGLSTKSRVEVDFYTSFCMSPTFAGWLASRVESLGLAVAQSASSSSLTVPNVSVQRVTGTAAIAHGHGKKGSIGLGIVAPMTDLNIGDGRSSPQPCRDSSDGETRVSSDGSSVVGGKRWRTSDERERERGVANDDFGGGRRGSVW